MTAPDTPSREECAWMMATPFTQCTEWSKYVDHMLRILSTKAKP